MLSWLGIFIGVVAILIVSSVMNGLREDMMKRIIETKAEIRIYQNQMKPIDNYEELLPMIENTKDVIAVSPIIVNELLIQKEDNISVINSFGIDLKSHDRISKLKEQIRIGSYSEDSFENDGIIIGLDLSLILGATVGEYVRISSPMKTEPTPIGLLPKSKRFRIAAIFTSGMPDYDKAYAFLSLDNGRFFSGYDNEIDQLQVKIKNSHKSEKVAYGLQQRLGQRYHVEDWSIFDSSLFEAMKLEKIVMLTVLALMLIISGFNMACSSIRMVSEKQIEIGILKALGMKTQLINKSFLMINLAIGLSAITIGSLVSAIFIVIQERFQIIEIPVPGFPMHWLPVVPYWLDFVTVSSLVVVITVSATIIPLKKIAQTEPISVIRKV